MRNRILTKESVLDAAEKIIVEEGMAQCSMRRISSALGVAVGTIYNYYVSREELLVDLFTISWKRTVSKVQSVVDPSRARGDQIGEFFDVILEDVKNRNGLGKEIYIFNSYVKEVEENTLNIRKELSRILASILNQKVGEEKANEVICLWMITIFVDALINERELSDVERKMMVKIIAIDFDLD